jgi:hypothetical protein
MKNKMILFFFFLPSLWEGWRMGCLFAQDNLLNMLDTLGQKDEQTNKVTAAFKTTKIISLQTIVTKYRGELDFNITHRFGSMGTKSNGGIHTFYGYDNASDIRFSFDYGITDKLQIGIGRSKQAENIDGSLKWRFLEQTLNNKIPLSIAAYSVASLTPVRQSQLYAGADSLWVVSNKNFLHRLSYTSQILFARKFDNLFSFELAPTFTHRNYVLGQKNSNNNAEDENSLFSLAAGFRIRITRSFSLLADYFYVLSDFRKNNPNTSYYNPLAVGVEIETGGHVFHINFTNASGIIENYFIPNTTDSWLKGGYKFGFNIARTFTLKSK